MKDQELELTKEMKEKETELLKEMNVKEQQVTKLTEEIYQKETVFRDVNDMLKKQNLKLLKAAECVTLRAALGKCCRNFGERTCLLINFYLGGSHLSLFPIYTQHPPLTELFQEDYVLPAVGLTRRAQITEDKWDDFLAKNVEIRERIMRHTRWKEGKIGRQIGYIYTTLSARIHAHQQGGDALVIRDESLTHEQCLGYAALICGCVNIEFHDPTLAKKWEKKEKKK